MNYENSFIYMQRQINKLLRRFVFVKIYINDVKI